MPQLNPAPWFTVLVFSWLIFLLVIPSKVMKHSFNNEPMTTFMEKPKIGPWTWPWH